ncbi:MAG: hypothetical protein IKX54_02215 [Lachnospiraceae bacterium]|nr:hypothetical protein [Lachnospiraceae bacterium]
MRKAGSRVLHGRALLLTAAILFASVFTTGCGPNYATDEQMKEYAAGVTHGETAKFAEKIGERRLHFTTERGVEFDVWTFDKDIQIDGSHVCYTSDYGIADDYEEGVCNLYKAEIEKLMEDSGLRVVVYSPQFDCLSAFTLAVDESASEKQIAKVNAFLAGLRDIAKREEAFHSDGFSISFSCVGYLRGANGLYHRVLTGRDGWELVITANTPDEYLNVRNWTRTDVSSENVVSPDRNGVLVEVTAK